MARVFVAVTPGLGVVGFYSLSALSLSLESVPEELAHRLPRYDAIPAALIGRLARDERVRGTGVGELLLADAMQRILGAGRSVAVFAIVVDAKDERAADFYRAFGFREFPLQPSRLFLLTSTAAAVRRVPLLLPARVRRQDRAREALPATLLVHPPVIELQDLTVPSPNGDPLGIASKR